MFRWLWIASLASNFGTWMQNVGATWLMTELSASALMIALVALVLWLAGRYSKEVYAIDTTDGRLLARIKVGKGPHGLCVYPQPGRYSLGHTGVFR